MDEAVIFAGMCANTEDFYSVMDVFCFPSLWEGLGIALVEAQTNGLRCIVSEAITPDADIGAGLNRRLSLKNTDDKWADAILAYKGFKHLTDAVAYAEKAGYDIDKAAKRLESFYLTRGKLTVS